VPRSSISNQTAREGALAAAHRLSGALGMFGYHEASACASEIESTLAGGPSPDGSHLAELVTRLRSLLEKTEVHYKTRLEKDDS
jgi:HPt (histidine-containing phosphotransfer) domain-containing protein